MDAFCSDVTIGAYVVEQGSQICLTVEIRDASNGIPLVYSAALPPHKRHTRAIAIRVSSSVATSVNTLCNVSLQI